MRWAGVKRNFTKREITLGLSLLVGSPLAATTAYFLGFGLLSIFAFGCICVICGFFYFFTRDDLFLSPLLIGLLVIATSGLIYLATA